jgi:PiT family inorganic phosphate transporter
MSAAFDARLGPHVAAPVKPHLDRPLDIRFALAILAVLALGLFYMAYSIRSDISAAGGGPTTILPFILLGVAMLIALGFEFVNGFHDTANAVATVIYTHALPAEVAVVWSGCWNLLGVLASTGAVAFGIVSLLPVELILQVGSSSGYAMVFALLISAIIWNLGTWWLGLPASSSHTLIGSIVGVGVANALLRGQDGTDLDETVARKLVEVIHQVRELDLKKPPSIAESIDWARALLLLGADDIDQKTFKETMSVIVKHRTDLDTVAERVGVKLEPAQAA